MQARTDIEQARKLITAIPGPKFRSIAAA